METLHPPKLFSRGERMLLVPAGLGVLVGIRLQWNRLLYNAPLYAAHADRGVGDRRGELSAARTGAGAATGH